MRKVLASCSSCPDETQGEPLQADTGRQVKRDNIEPINKIYGLLVLDRSVQLAQPAVNC